MDKQEVDAKEGRFKNPLSRRGFMKGVGLVTTGVVAGPILRDLVPTFQAPRIFGLPGTKKYAIKVGAVIPGSSVYPNLGQDQFDGLVLGFRQFGGLNPNVSVELITEAIGNTPRLAREKSLKLVNDDKVDIMVGVVGTHALRDIHEVFVGS